MDRTVTGGPHRTCADGLRLVPGDAPVGCAECGSFGAMTCAESEGGTDGEANRAQNHSYGCDLTMITIYCDGAAKSHVYRRTVHAGRVAFPVHVP